MWTAVDHEVTVGGDDSRNIEIAGTKIADTEARIKSSGKGWVKMIANPDLKLPKDFKLTLDSTTFSIEGSGSTTNPKIQYYYHILDSSGKSKQFWIASYEIFNFRQWLLNNLIYFIVGIIALIVAILTVIAATVGVIFTCGGDIPVFLEGDAAIISELVELTADDAIAAGVPVDYAEQIANIANGRFGCNLADAIDYFNNLLDVREGG